MNTNIIGFTVAALLAGPAALQAQAPKKEEEKTVIIQKKEHSDKDGKTVIVIEDGRVTINGKPAGEYQGGRRKLAGEEENIIINGEPLSLKMHSPNKAMLGVLTDKNEKGALIKEVTAGSAADKAGLKAGDIITAINQHKTEDPAALQKAVGAFKPDDTIDIVYLREGKEKKVKATLGKNEAPEMAWGKSRFRIPLPGIAGEPGAPHAFSWNSGDDLPAWAFGPKERPRFGMSIEDNADGNGVKVIAVHPGSNAEKAGLKASDLITAVDGQTTKDTDSLREQLAEAKDKDKISLQIVRSGRTETLTIKTPKRIKKAEL